MKNSTIIILFFSVLALTGLGGFILPALISAKDSLMVAGGFGIIFILLLFGALTINNVVGGNTNDEKTN